MDFGSSKFAAVDLEDRGQNRNSTNRSEASLPRLMERSRLTEEDLEQFRLNIVEQHKKKHYRVLLISLMLFLFMIVISFLVFF